MQQIVRCPTSDHRMFRDVRQMTLGHKGESEIVDMPGWYCEECGESIHSGIDMKVSNQALYRMKARTHGLLEPQEVRRIRKRLGLTRKAAESLMGVGPGVFRKYESGAELVSGAISGMLILLERDPDGLDVLRERFGSARTA